jgi:hypothetical protein
MPMLNVYLHGRKVGILSSDDGRLSFRYDPDNTRKILPHGAEGGNLGKGDRFRIGKIEQENHRGGDKAQREIIEKISCRGI